MWATLSSDFLHSFVYLIYFLSCSLHFSFFVSYISRLRSALYILLLLSFHFMRSFYYVNLGHLCLNPLSQSRSLLFYLFYSLSTSSLSPSFAVFSFPRTPVYIYISRSISLFFSLPPFIFPRVYLIPC